MCPSSREHCAAGRWGASPPPHHPGGGSLRAPLCHYAGTEERRPAETYYCRLASITPPGKTNPSLLPMTSTKKTKKNWSRQILPKKKAHPSIIATIQRSQRLLLKGNFNTAKSLLCRNKQLQQTVMKDKAGRSQKDTSALPPRLCSPDGTHTAAFEKPKFPLCFVFFFFFLSSTTKAEKYYLSLCFISGRLR